MEGHHPSRFPFLPARLSTVRPATQTIRKAPPPQLTRTCAFRIRRLGVPVQHELPSSDDPVGGLRVLRCRREASRRKRSSRSRAERVHVADRPPDACRSSRSATGTGKTPESGSPSRSCSSRSSTPDPSRSCVQALVHSRCGNICMLTLPGPRSNTSPCPCTPSSKT